MTKIKVKPEEIRAFANVLQESLNSYNTSNVIKDETSHFQGNIEATNRIEDLNNIVNELKEALGTFVSTLTDFAMVFEEKDREL